MELGNNVLAFLIIQIFPFSNALNQNLLIVNMNIKISWSFTNLFHNNFGRYFSEQFWSVDHIDEIEDRI